MTKRDFYFFYFGQLASCAMFVFSCGLLSACLAIETAAFIVCVVAVIISYLTWSLSIHSYEPVASSFVASPSQEQGTDNDESNAN